MTFKKLFVLLLCAVLSVSLSGCDSAGRGKETTANLTTAPMNKTSGDPYAGMTPAEKLVAIGNWEKDGNPQAIMSFEADGTGFIVSGGIKFKQSWKLEENILKTTTEIRADIITPTEYKFVMSDDSFIITNTETNVSARFLFAGTQSVTLPQEGEKISKFFGDWIPENNMFFGYHFADEGEESGRFSTGGSGDKIDKKFDWTIYDYYLYIFYEDGQQFKFEYDISGDVLTIYQNNQAGIKYYRNK